MSSISPATQTGSRSAKQIWPPGPKARPILGLLPEFRRNPADFLLQIASQYGDLVHFRVGPRQHMFLLNRPEYVQDVLVTHQANFIKSRMLQRSKVLLGEGLLTSEGAFHLRQRRLAQPAFHRERLKGYAVAMTECSVQEANLWHAGETRNIAQDMMHLTLKIVARTLFSTDVEQEAKAVGEALDSMMGLFNTLMLPWSDLMQKLPLPSTKRFAKSRVELDRVIYSMIRARRASGEDKGDLLSMLLMAQDEQGDGGGMTDTQVRDEALTLFLAGHETTANLLTWTWYLLSQHPEVEARLHQELQQVLGGRAPEFADLPQLRYTEMVLAESMRLYPPAWGIGRMGLQDYEVDGYLIPKGAILLVCPYTMHRHPRYWPEPDKFDPQRWTPEARETRPKFAYFPFGGGTRVCIGERFAWMEGSLALATIAQKWKLRLVPGHRVEHLPQLTLRTRYGMQMTVEPR